MTHPSDAERAMAEQYLARALEQLTHDARAGVSVRASAGIMLWRAARDLFVHGARPASPRARRRWRVKSERAGGLTQ